MSKTVANIITLILVISAFCICPTAATLTDTPLPTYEYTPPKGVVHMGQNYDILTDIEKALLETVGNDCIKYAYMAITNCDNGQRCTLIDLNDPTDPHPEWADWLELEKNNPVTVIDGVGMIYPPDDDNQHKAKPLFISDAMAFAPAVGVGIGYIIAELPPVVLYSSGAIAIGGVIITIAADNYNPSVTTILNIFSNNPLFKIVNDHISYIDAIKHVKQTENHRDVIIEDKKGNADDIVKNLNKNEKRYLSISTYQTKADKDNGCPKQIRYYDEKGNKDYDVDFTHDNKYKNHIFPHIHKWIPSKGTGPARVDMDSTVETLTKKGTPLTQLALNDAKAMITDLSNAILSNLHNDPCKDYDYLKHNFKKTDL